MSVPFRVIAHRGDSAHAPENTIASFASALEAGASEVELDVRFSSDLEIIVFHDDSLERKTALEGRVRHYTAATLRRVDIGSWFDRSHPDAERSYAGTCLASLHEVFEALGSSVHYHVEIKDSDDLFPLRLVQHIDAHGLSGQVTFTSFSMRPLLAVRRLVPHAPICFLLRDAHDALRSAEFRPVLEGRSLEEVQDYWVDAAADAGFQHVGMRAADVTPRCLSRAADRGLFVRGWGVRDERDLQLLLDLGAIGATVDWPKRGLEIVGAHAARRRSSEKKSCSPAH